MEKKIVQDEQLQDCYDNIITKLQFYMKRSNQTIHGMATKMGFAYQPFYRLMTKKSPPTLYSIYNIASNLECSVSELIDKTIFLDVNSYCSIEDYATKKKSNKKIRVYCSLELANEIEDKEIFITESNITDDKVLYPINNIEYYLNTNIYQLYIGTNKVILDGVFLVKYQNKIQLLNVINASSSVINVTYENKIQQIRVQDIDVYAKFCSFINLSNSYTNTLSGVLL